MSTLRALAAAVLVHTALVVATGSAVRAASGAPVAAEASPLASAAAASSVAPAETSPRRARPWSVRTDAFALRGAGLSGATADAFGLSVQKTFFERWAWEETVAWGAGNRQVEGKDLGLNLAGTLRFAALMSAARSSALSLGLGTALILGGGYGHLNFVFAELGYEYRARDGLSLLLAAGPNWLAAGPSRSSCRDAWLCGAFHSGDLAPVGHVRAGVGWAF
jgi:hypothetical protein